MMKVKPGKRVDDIKIGATKDDIISLLGTPEDTFNHEHSLYWRYPNKGLDIQFEKLYGGRVSCIHVYAQEIPAGNLVYKPAQLSYKNAIDLAMDFGPPDKVESDFVTGVCLEMRYSGINAFYDENKLMTICIWKNK